MGAYGIGDDSVVVAYDDMGGMVAARLVVMLRMLGRDAALLDGAVPDAFRRRRPVEAAAAFERALGAGMATGGRVDLVGAGAVHLVALGANAIEGGFAFGGIAVLGERGFVGLDDGFSVTALGCEQGAGAFAELGVLVHLHLDTLAEGERPGLDVALADGVEQEGEAVGGSDEGVAGDVADGGREAAPAGEKPF